jgi:hypothetical protein
MDTKLVETLKALHSELEQTQPLDAESRALLEHIAKDIQLLVQEPQNASAQHYQSLGERATQLVARLENTNPQLTLLLGNLLDHLSNI